MNVSLPERNSHDSDSCSSVNGGESTAGNSATGNSNVLQTLQTTNQLLAKLMNQMKKTVHRVEAIEERLDASNSTSSSSSGHSTHKTTDKRIVPLPVRVGDMLICVLCIIVHVYVYVMFV